MLLLRRLVPLNPSPQIDGEHGTFKTSCHVHHVQRSLLGKARRFGFLNVFAVDGSAAGRACRYAS